jgi:hypothetical protein
VRFSGLSFSASHIADQVARETLNRVNSYKQGTKAAAKDPELGQRFSDLGNAYPNVPFKMNAYQAMAGTNAGDVVAFNTAMKTQEILAKQNQYNIDPVTKVGFGKRAIQLGMLGLDAAFQPVSRGFKSAVVAAQQEGKNVFGTVALATLAGIPEIFIGDRGQGGGSFTKGVLNTIAGDGVGDAYKAARDKYGPTELTMAINEYRKGKPLNLGTGFLPRSVDLTQTQEYLNSIRSGEDVSTAYAKAKNKYGRNITGLHDAREDQFKYTTRRGEKINISPGRVVAAQMLEPGTTGYSVVSGVIDGVFRVAADPVNLALMYGAGVKTAMRGLVSANQKALKAKDPTTILLKTLLPGKTGKYNRSLYYGRTVDDVRATKWGQDFGRAIANLTGDEGMSLLNDIPEFRNIPVAVKKVLLEVDDPIHVWDILDIVAKGGNLTDTQLDTVFNVIKQYTPKKVSAELDRVRALSAQNKEFGLQSIPAKPTVYGEFFNYMNKLITGKTTDVAPMRKFLAMFNTSDPARGLLGVGAQAKMLLPKQMQRAFSLRPETTVMITQLDESIKNIDNNLKNAFVDAKTRGAYVNEALTATSQKELDEIVNRVNQSIGKSIQNKNPQLDIDVVDLVKQQQNFAAETEELRKFFSGTAGSLAFNGTKIKKRYTQLIKDTEEYFKRVGVDVDPKDLERYIFEAVPTMHLLTQASTSFSTILDPQAVVRASKAHQTLIGPKDSYLRAWVSKVKPMEEMTWADRLSIPRKAYQANVKNNKIELKPVGPIDTIFNNIQNDILKPSWMLRAALALRIAPEEALRAAFGGKVNPFTQPFKRLALTSNKYYDFFGEGRADEVALIYNNLGRIIMTTQMKPDDIAFLKNIIDIDDIDGFKAMSYNEAEKLIKHKLLEINPNGTVSEYMVDAAVNNFDLKDIKFAELTDKDFIAKTKKIKATSKGAIVGYNGKTYNSMGEAFIESGGFSVDLDERQFFDLQKRAPAEADAFVSPYKEKELNLGKLADIERSATEAKLTDAEYLDKLLDDIFFDEDTIGLLSKDKHVMGTYIDSEGNFMVDVAVGLTGDKSISNAVFLGMNAFQESVYVANAAAAKAQGFSKALGKGDLIKTYRAVAGKGAKDINIDSVINKPALEALFDSNFEALRITKKDVKGAAQGMPGGGLFSADETYNASLGEAAVTRALLDNRKDLIENMFIDVEKYLPNGNINPRYWEALWTEIELLGSDPVVLKVVNEGVDGAFTYFRTDGKDTLEELVKRSFNSEDKIYTLKSAAGDKALKEYLESIQYRVAKLLGAEHQLLDPVTGAVLSAEQGTKVSFQNGGRVHPKFVSDLSSVQNSQILEMIKTGGVLGRKDWIRYKQHNQLRQGTKKGKANAKFYEELIDVLGPEVDGAGLGPRTLPARFDATQRLSDSGTMIAGEKIVPAGYFDDVGYSTHSQYHKVLDGAYDWLISKPSNRLNRDPLFRYAFYENAIELMAYMDEPTKAQFLKGAETWVDGNKLWDELIEAAKQPSVENTVTSLEQAETLLKHAAMKEVKTLFYSTANRHVASDLFSKYIPFPEIWAEVFQSWGKLIRENPQKFNRTRIAVDNGEEAKPWDSENGFLERDPRTDKLMFNYVDALNILSFGVLGTVLEKRAQNRAFGQDLTDQGVRMALPGYAGGLNLIAQNGFAPGFGPLVTVPMSYLVNTIPTPKFIQDFFLGNFGRETEQWPAWLKKFMTGDFSTDVNRQAQFGNAVMDGYSAFVLAGLVDQEDPVSVNKYMDLATERARKLYIFRGTTQFTFPTAIQPKVEVQDKNGEWWATQALKIKYDELLIKNDYDYFQTDIDFENKFGINPIPLTQAKGGTVGRKPTKEHSYFWWEKDNRRDLLKSSNLPNTGIYIQPDKIEDELYYPAWYEMISTQYKPEQYGEFMRHSQAIFELEKQKEIIREENPESMWETLFSEAKLEIETDYGFKVYSQQGKLKNTDTESLMYELSRWGDFDLTKNSPEYPYVVTYLEERNKLLDVLNNGGTYRFQGKILRVGNPTRSSRQMSGTGVDAQKAQEIMRLIWVDIVKQSNGTNFPQLANEVLFYEISPNNPRNQK